VSEWGAGTKRMSGTCGGGRQTRDVGASMTGCEREVRDRGVWLTCGVHGPARAQSNRRSTADRKVPPSSG
jgi:hypothetical protein